MNHSISAISTLSLHDALPIFRCVLDETFGQQNFCGLISFSKTVGATSELLPGTVDYLLWYAKDRARVKYRPRSEEHTSELQSHVNLVCRLLLEKKKQVSYIIF